MFQYFLAEPLRTLTEWWPIQAAVAFFATLSASLLSRVIEGYEILLTVEEWLVLGAATMFILDLLSGLLGTLRYDHITFSPAALKRSGFKAIEWAFIITGSVVLAGAAREQGIFLIDQLHVGAIFWLMTTDFISMLFNLKGSDGRAMISGMAALAEGDVGAFLDKATSAAKSAAGEDMSSRGSPEYEQSGSRSSTGDPHPEDTPEQSSS